jgi:hypothetical protein
MVKEPKVPKFTAQLLAPILIKLPEHDADGRLILDLTATVERFRKLELLARHYQATGEDGKVDFSALAMRLACDFVPGFEVLYDEPAARTAKLPNTYRGGGRKLKGSGKLPEELNGPLLLRLFETFRQSLDESEREIAGRIAVAVRPELKGTRNRKEREGAAKSLRNRLAAARKTVRDRPIS